MTMRERLARAIFFRGDKQDDVQWDYVRRDLAEKAMAQADAVLAEIAAAGMVLVPREPTEAMLRAVTPARSQDHSNRAVYRAMLSAAPAAD